MSDMLTVPIEIPTPEAAEGYTLTDVQSSFRNTFFTYERDGEKKFFVCGSNEHGQLGLGYNRNSVTVPTEIATPKAAEGYTLTDVQLREFSTFLTCVNAQGEKKFFACGYNLFGELGLGHRNEVTVPEEIPTPEAAEGYTLTDVQLREVSTVLTCVNAQGEKKLFVCGKNAYGQLGLGHSNEVTVPTEIVTLKAAEGFTLTTCAMYL